MEIVGGVNVASAIQQASCSDGDRQVFKVRNFSNGQIAISNINGTMALEIVNASKTPGAALATNTPANVLHQRFEIIDVVFGIIFIRSANSKQLLQITSGATNDGARVVQANLANGNNENQVWLFVPAR